MSKKLQAIRGMNDILPDQTPIWQHVEGEFRQLLASFAYREIRMPMVEPTELFKRSIGEVTDIVEKEMYTFDDRNGESLTLRPEGTASCVRACEEHGLLYNQIQRLWYTGPMFRYEKPQKGRYRQFHQIGVEAFGMAGPDIDAEIILMTANYWQRLGVDKVVTLELNSLGSNEARQIYKEALVAYLEQYKDQLDEDSQRRLGSNPLRILDSKDEKTQAILSGAPKLTEYLDEESKNHFEGLKSCLDHLGISYVVNPKLVRGLDYYNHTVFEWVTTELGAQGTVCAGGRYDGLVSQLGGKPTPAVGFAMGVERLILLLEKLELTGKLQPELDLYITAVGANTSQAALSLANEVRGSDLNASVLCHSGGGSFKSQMKKADKSGARLALILGEDEIAKQQVGVKFLREDREQETVNFADLVDFLHSVLN